MPEVKFGLTKYFNNYKNYRPHQSLNNLTPAEIHLGQNKKPAFFKQFNNLNNNLNTIPVQSTF
jgi:hypothetical protein